MRTTRVLAAILFGLVIFGAAPLARADGACVDYGRMPHQVGQLAMPGSPHGVAMAGHYAYVANREAGLQIVDIADPAHPVTVGSVATPGTALMVAIAGSHAYVTAGEAGGLQVIDISDPTHPFIVGSLLTPGSVGAVAIAGHFAYLAASETSDGLVVVDVSDPASPQLASGSAAHGRSAWDVAVAGHYAYVTDNSYGLRVFDISDPYAPVIVDALATDESFWGIAVAVVGDTVYLGTWDQWYIIDAHDPANLSIVKTLDGGVEHFAIDGSWAYIWGLEVFDISNPRDPAPAGFAPMVGRARQAAVLGDIACVTVEGQGLVVADVSHREVPAAIGRAGFPGNNGGYLAVAGDIAVVADGLWMFGYVLDVADPAAPALLDTVDLPHFPSAVAMSGTLAYMAVVDSLLVIDVADPSDARIVGSAPMAGDWALQIAVRGSHAWVACDDFGLQVFSLADPRHPVLVSALALPYGVRDMAVSDSLACLVSGGDLCVVDIADPASPVLLGTLPVAWSASAVAIKGDVAYVACYEYGLAVIDIADPAHPAEITSVGLPGDCNDISVAANAAYFAGSAGLLVADLTDPRAPRLTSGLPLRDVASGIESQGHLFVTAYEQGLMIYPAQCQYIAAAPEPRPTFAGLQLSAYPNPVAREMSISFATSRGGPVQGDIYDVAGRLVRRLPAMDTPGGSHRLEWDGRDDDGRTAPAGVYLVRVKTPDGVATTRVAKIR